MQGLNNRAAGTEDCVESRCMCVYMCVCVCVLIFRYSSLKLSLISGLATLAHVSGSWHSPWLATIQRLPVLH